MNPLLTVAVACLTAALVLVSVAKTAYNHLTVPEIAQFGWMWLTGKVRPWRGVADPILLAGRYARLGLTAADVRAWGEVMSGHTLDTRAPQVATLVRAGWDPSDYRPLGSGGWSDLHLLARAVTFGLTADDLRALTAMPHARPIMMRTITGASKTPRDAMNWFAGLPALHASSQTLAMTLDDVALTHEIWRWRRDVGPDASWYAAAGCSLDEAIALAKTPDPLPGVKVMAALRQGA